VIFCLFSNSANMHACHTNRLSSRSILKLLGCRPRRSVEPVSRHVRSRVCILSNANTRRRVACAPLVISVIFFVRRLFVYFNEFSSPLFSTCVVILAELFLSYVFDCAVLVNTVDGFSGTRAVNRFFVCRNLFAA